MTLFVDTSVWYAAADAGDRSNQRAEDILSNTEDLITTDHVLVETWVLLRNKMGKHVAEAFWSGLHKVCTIEHITVEDLEVARLIGQDFSDQDFSIVDRTSFAVMQRLIIKRVASFDSDFSVFRYGRKRSLAFEVIGPTGGKLR